MKNSKLLVSIVLALMLVMVFSFTAMAADQPVAINADQPTPISAIQPIAIQLDGKNIATGDVAPVIVDGRTFIPFRVLFEAMGATVSYNEDTRTVSATKDKLAINFAVGQKDITVTQDNKKEVITTDAASFISNGRTLVPVRFAAQSLGATVGWDAAKRTVLIADTNKLIKAYAGKFTIMDMLLADSAQQAKQSYAFTGTMKMNLKITDEGKAYPMIMDAKMTGISSATAMEMNVKMSISMDELIKEAIAADATTKEQLEAMAAQLKNIDCDYIMDLSTGIYYLKADIFSTALDLEKGTWISIDLNKMLQDLGLEELGLGSVEDLN
ncbi:MAG: copper amine oxidase N-terminal domain-containing protein, partial [Clostridiales bacterium]